MRHVFILNPVAGKSEKAMTLQPMIEEYFRDHWDEQNTFEIHVTERPGHATNIARREAGKGDAVRIYACGGDGTLMEAATGIAAFRNAELVCIPCGSANDYIRVYGEDKQFRDLGRMIRGRSYWVDAILCNDKLSLNICSMGMDADVCLHKDLYKHWPLVSGPMAYNLSLVRTFCHPMGDPLEVDLDVLQNGELCHIHRSGTYMFALAANGQYYGGGYRGAPRANPGDGMLNFVLIDKMKRLEIVRKLSQYRNGQHMSWSNCETFTGLKMSIHSPRKVCINVDGYCFQDNEVTFELLPKCIRFVLPEGFDPESQPQLKGMMPAECATILE